MGAIKLDFEAAKAMLGPALEYGEKNHLLPHEMGVALVVAGTTILSRGMNNVQLEEVFTHVAKLTAELRKPNAS